MPPRWLALPEAYASPPRLYAWSARNFPTLTDNKFTSDHSTQSQSHKRIYIIGIGNLGRLFAMCLAKSPTKPPITLVVHRKEQLEEWIRRPGIEILRGDAVINSRNFAVEWWSEDKPRTGPAVEVAHGKTLNHVIVATKASAALRQVDRARRYLGPDSCVAFAQNGMGRMWPPYGTQVMESRFGSLEKSPSWVAMVTKHGVTSLGLFRSRHASEADVAFGTVWDRPGSDSTRYLAGLLVEAPKLEARELPRAELWVHQLEKLVINAVLNPMTAVLRVKNGDIFTDPEGPVGRVVDRLISEASEVVTALIRSDAGRDILGEKADDESLLKRFSHQCLREMIYDLGINTVGENLSSMLQDVKTGKETEVQEFNGWLVETGQFLGLQNPLNTNKALIKLVEAAAVVTPDTIEEQLAAKSQ
ncbi:hypothetical protein TD95_004630 [Thielaviopsis punctulata]|uniref:2-dehydropantoate 2-reductase n=1 Tax=Thielaviopsis punctulata TaxID=72032 RepID=A0A0F4ZB10_9PEZI|nr:hypothetical protein TD95_004630 [Thielaviopsis punctulata]